jgi:hypothetical protein
MTEEEVDHVAQELAKVGGTSWYPGRTSGGLLRNVGERYRDRARVAISALDRLRTSKQAVKDSGSAEAGEPIISANPPDFYSGKLEVGTVVIYRPPGDQRAIPCQVKQVRDGQVYLVPCPRPNVGWVDVDSADLVAPPKDGSAA